MSEIFTLAQIRSFCERMEGQHARGIIDFSTSVVQWNNDMWAIIKISLILSK